MSDDDDDNDFPFAGRSLEWIMHFAGIMRELATEAPTAEMRASYAEIARECEEYLARATAPPR